MLLNAFKYDDRIVVDLCTSKQYISFFINGFKYYSYRFFKLKTLHCKMTQLGVYQITSLYYTVSRYGYNKNQTISVTRASFTFVLCVIISDINVFEMIRSLMLIWSNHKLYNLKDAPGLCIFGINLCCLSV